MLPIVVSEARHQVQQQREDAQIALFRNQGVRHPESVVFRDAMELKSYVARRDPPGGYPCVLKGDTGGGGIFTSFLLELLVYPVIFEMWEWHSEVKREVVKSGSHHGGGDV